LAKENEYLALSQEIGFIEQVAEQFVDNCLITSKRTKRKMDQESLAWLALNALRFYIAIEDIFARVAKVVDETVPSGRDSHIPLLRQMAVEMPGKRPAIISSTTFSYLNDLRSFRHRMIHAYQDPLEWDKMSGVIQMMPACFNALGTELQVFRKFLQGVAEIAQKDGEGL